MSMLIGIPRFIQKRSNALVHSSKLKVGGFTSQSICGSGSLSILIPFVVLFVAMFPVLP